MERLTKVPSEFSSLSKRNTSCCTTGHSISREIDDASESPWSMLGALRSCPKETVQGIGGGEKKYKVVGGVNSPAT